MLWLISKSKNWKYSLFHLLNNQNNNMTAHVHHIVSHLRKPFHRCCKDSEWPSPHYSIPEKQLGPKPTISCAYNISDVRSVGHHELCVCVCVCSECRYCCTMRTPANENFARTTQLSRCMGKVVWHRHEAWNPFWPERCDELPLRETRICTSMEYYTVSYSCAQQPTSLFVCSGEKWSGKMRLRFAGGVDWRWRWRWGWWATTLTHTHSSNGSGFGVKLLWKPHRMCVVDAKLQAPNELSSVFETMQQLSDAAPDATLRRRCCVMEFCAVVVVRQLRSSSNRTQ